MLPTMLNLTKQEQLVLAFVIALILTGLAVKTYRKAHPTSQNSEHAAH